MEYIPPQKISRKDEELIPTFNSHVEARRWFKEKYGSDFTIMGADQVGDEICYFYHLVLDWETYMKGQKELRATGNVTGLEYLYSHQPIQIMHSGHIHIVH